MHNQNGLTVNGRGHRRWRLRGLTHRDDGPAYESEEHGYQAWYIHGLRHRTDGPAIIWARGRETEWWLNHVEYTFEEWLSANTELSEEQKVMLKLKYG